MMQLYNEEVNDLLAPENMKLPIHESKENGVYVCGLREDIVTGPEQVLALLEEGESNRHIGSTKMNDTSSRSHTVFRMASVVPRGMDTGAMGCMSITWGAESYSVQHIAMFMGTRLLESYFHLVIRPYRSPRVHFLKTI